LGKMVRPPSEARTERRASVILCTLGGHRAGERFGASGRLSVSSTVHSVKLSERVGESDEKRRGTGMFWTRLCLRPRCFCGRRDSTTPSIFVLAVVYLPQTQLRKRSMLVGIMSLAVTGVQLQPSEKQRPNRLLYRTSRLLNRDQYLRYRTPFSCSPLHSIGRFDSLIMIRILPSAAQSLSLSTKS
jgi:hypothetical protein